MKKIIQFTFLGTLSITLSMSVMSQTNDKLFYPFTFAPSEGMVNKVEKAIRKEICLNGQWEFQAMSLPEGYDMGKGQAPTLAMPKADGWKGTKIKIPSPWNINSFANRDLEGPDHRNYPSYPHEWDNVRMAWMRRTVTIPNDWADNRIKIHFEAVSGFAEVYVKGKKVVENFDIFLPFEADITDVVTPGETVELLVGVRDQALFEDRLTVGRRMIPAGSMWGYHIRGIWQDVYLVALPQIHVENIFVKPLVAKNLLQVEVNLRNASTQKATIYLQATINEWLNKAGTDVNSAPVPAWELGRKALEFAGSKIAIEARSELTTTLYVQVKEGVLEFWTPLHPNLYALTLSLCEAKKGKVIDCKYERFGWREWSVQGTKYCLNGEPIELIGDSWHFMGIPQMTRRYAWAWFTAIKAMNGNAVRPHAQIYPKFYLDVADELGICVLNETANWASDGGPKLDAEEFWEASKEHLRRFVLRDRNHASVFGWSISNENKPVILHVFNRPELMPFQEQAWKDWRDIVNEYDPTRPWISADGEDDGNGTLPVTVGHYGDVNSMKRWVDIGKPWGIGEHSMAYYGTPEQVSKYNGEEAYESQYGRMKGLAKECYNLLAEQRRLGATYVSVFNMAWYGLKPLPIGKKNLKETPSIEKDGVFFSAYKEGMPGVQPERMGPYCTTFNPGYDPSLPLYDPWPMFEAMRAANAPGAPAWSPYAENKSDNFAASPVPSKTYKEVVFIGNEEGALKQVMNRQNVTFSVKITTPQQSLYIIDGRTPLADAQEKAVLANIAKGADVWLWGVTSETIDRYSKLLPLSLQLEKRAASSYIPEQKSWMKGLNNSGFYFSEIQRSNASELVMSGDFVAEGEVLLNVCGTDWRKWNRRPEEIKTASVLRSENEAIAASAVFVKYTHGASTYYVSTLIDFANSEKGHKTLSGILQNAGVPCEVNNTVTDELLFMRDERMSFSSNVRDKMLKDGENYVLNFWIWSPRALDDLLIEPDMPKLDMYVDAREGEVIINEKLIEKKQRTDRNQVYRELMLSQGWNKVSIKINENDSRNFGVSFGCNNHLEFLSKLKVSFSSQDTK